MANILSNPLVKLVMGLLVQGLVAQGQQHVQNQNQNRRKNSHQNRNRNRNQHRNQNGAEIQIEPQKESPYEASKTQGYGDTRLTQWQYQEMSKFPFPILDKLVEINMLTREEADFMKEVQRRCEKYRYT